MDSLAIRSSSMKPLMGSPHVFQRDANRIIGSWAELDYRCPSGSHVLLAKSSLPAFPVPLIPGKTILAGQGAGLVLQCPFAGPAPAHRHPESGQGLDPAPGLVAVAPLRE